MFLGEAGTRAETQALIEKYRSLDLDSVFDAATRQWDDILGTVQIKTPDRRARHPHEPLADLPIARLPDVGAHRILPGERRLRLPRPVAGFHGGMPHAARSRARASSCAPRRGNSRKATCSIGGCRRAGAASAPTSPTTASARPCRGALREHDGRHRPFWTYKSRSSKHRCCGRRTRCIRAAEGQRTHRQPVRAMSCWRSTARWRPGRTACR